MWKNLLYYLTQKKVQHTCHHISNQSVAGVHCRSLMFENPVRGYALQQHVFKQIYLSMGIKPYSDCKNRCLMENTCVSVNVCPMDSGSVNWVILITFNILLTLNPKKDTSIGLQRYRYLDRTQYDRFIFQLSLVWLYWVFITINPTKGKFILAESMFKQPLFS